MNLIQSSEAQKETKESFIFAENSQGELIVYV